jgi:hypothetical protein
MQVLRRAAIAMALALPLATLPLTAQKYRWDFNVNGGYSWLSGDLVDRDIFRFDDIDIIDPDLDFIDDFRDVSLGDGPIVGAQLGYWFGGSKRVGLRANFAFTDSDVETLGTFDLFDPDFLFNPFETDVNLWSGSGDLLIRLKTPHTRWDGMEWLPYVALGLGAQWINPAGNGFFLVDNVDIDLDPDLDGILDIDGNSGVPITCRRRFIDTDIDLLDHRCAFLEEGSSLMGLLAIGMDMRLSPNFALRFEFGDRIWEAPVKAAVQVDDLFDNVFAEVGDFGNTVNQLYLTAGAAILFGLEQPPRRVTVVPRPAPPPPPPPATEEITVCVIDPTYAGGARNITATRHLSNGDTTVMKNGTSVRLSEAYGTVPVASNATWFISGAPLEIGTAPNRLLYVTVGGARMINPDELAFIGTVNGMPVFADRLTLAPVLTNLGPNTDLNRLVVESSAAREALESVTTVYVPLQPVGCVFQALQKQVEVRKK